MKRFRVTGRNPHAGAARYAPASPSSSRLCKSTPQLAHLAARAVLVFVGWVGIHGPLHAQSAPADTQRVIAALQAGRYSEAIADADLILKANPNSAKLWTLRALALERNGDKEQALQSYEHALKLNPNFLAALEGAAQIQYSNGSPDAVPLLQRIVTIQPQNAPAHGMLAVYAYRRQNYEDCAREFELAGGLVHSQPSAMATHALCLAHIDKTADAIAVLKELLQADPASKVARYDLALLQWRSNDEAGALATLQPLLDAPEGETAPLRLAATIHESQHETPAAVELLRKAIMTSPDDPANYVDFATLSFAHGSYSVGIDFLDRGIARMPNAPTLYIARGVLYGQNGDFEKAMADFDRAHQLDPKNAMAATAQGIAESQQHNHEEALRAFRRQVKQHPDDAFGYYLLAESLSWSGSEDSKTDPSAPLSEAIAMARKAKELDPKLVQARDLLASLYLQNGQIQDSIAECRAVLEHNPNDQQAIYTLMLAVRKKGDLAEAKELVGRLSQARKQEQEENARSARYGKLMEVH